MRRSPRSALALAAAFAVASVTAYVVFTDLQTLRRRAASLGAERDVVVATHELPLGSTVTEGDVRTTRMYGSVVPEGALTTLDSAIGRIIAVPVPAGAFVHEAHVTPSDRDAVDGLIPAGSRVVRLEPADGMQPPAGAVVDVFATLDPAFAPAGGATSASAGAVVVAAGARVLDTDAAGGGRAEWGSAGPAGVTLLVTEDEARRLAFASANSVLMLAVAPPEAACCSHSDR